MGDRETKVPAIPNPGHDSPGAVKALKEIVEVREGIRGDPLDAFVTYRNLKDYIVSDPTIVTYLGLAHDHTVEHITPIANSRILGRGTAGSGDAEEITLSSDYGLTFTYTAGALKINTPQDLRTTAGPSLDHLHLTVAIGTAPLVVTSTTLVSNLNVDQVDSLHAQTLTATSPITLSAATSVLAAAGITIAHAATSGNIHLPTDGAAAQLIQYTAAGTGKWITVSGDVTIADGGAITIGAEKVTYAKMQHVSATDKILGRSTIGAGDVEEIDCTAFGRSILDDANEATFKATVNLEIGTDVQAYHANLASLAGLSYVSASFVKMTAAGTFALDTGTYDPAGTGHTEATDHVATHAALITGVHGLVFTAGKTLTLTESLTLNALPVGGLAVATAANTLGSLAVGLTTQVLIGGGAATVPAWATDLPTAVTIGTKYIYRAEGTDIPPTDGGTGVSNAADHTITLAGPLSTVGHYTLELTCSNNTAVTLPVSGTLQTTTGTPAGFVIASQAVGDILYASTTSAWARLADVAAGAYLRSGGITTAPLWSTLLLPNAATAYRLVVATAANTIGELVASGAAGEYLAGATGAIPAWATLNQAAVTGLTTASSPVFVTVKLSGLTDGYVPYHVADATGLANSPIFTDGTNVGIGTTPGALLHVDQGASYWGTDKPPAIVAQSERPAVILYDDTTPAAANSVRGILNDDGKLYFTRNPYTTDYGYDERIVDITISTDGNVGIGVTDPDDKLEISGGGLHISTASQYLNFGATQGTNGYGIRDNAGVPEVKQTSGDWYSIAATSVVDVFTSDGTWTKRVGAKRIVIQLIGGGGGGGSGRKGAAGTVRTAGGGAGAGGASIVTLDASDCGSTEAVTIGTGGTGGASQTTDSTDGNVGANGLPTSFGALVVAGGGHGGHAGCAGSGLTAPGGRGTETMSAGLTSSTNGTAGGNVTYDDWAGYVGIYSGVYICGGGASGGGITNANAQSAGGYGYGGSYTANVRTAGGTPGAAGGGNGVAGESGTASKFHRGGGGGGGGGGSNLTGNGGSGGAGGSYGGGGGGGGASVDAVGNSGAGGNGGIGVAIIITYF